MAESAKPPLPTLDPGWLFLLAGAAVFVATILIPAADDAYAAERQAEQARVWADHQTRRVERYSEYLDALDRRDPALIASLAATHLHLTPAGKKAVLFDDPEWVAQQPINIFGSVEPAAPVTPPAYEPVNSLLGRLARGDRSRLILLAASAMCILIGALPATTRSRD